MTIEGRAVIHFFYLLDMPDKDVLTRLDSACSEGIINQNSAEWDLEISQREADLVDEPGPGRPDETKNCRQ
jgi:hypothetical protein